MLADKPKENKSRTKETSRNGVTPHDPLVCGIGLPEYPPNCPACLEEYLRDKRTWLIQSVAHVRDARQGEPWCKADVEDFAATCAKYPEIMGPALMNILTPAIAAEDIAPMLAVMVEAALAEALAERRQSA